MVMSCDLMPFVCLFFLLSIFAWLLTVTALIVSMSLNPEHSTTLTKFDSECLTVNFAPTLRRCDPF